MFFIVQCHRGGTETDQLGGGRGFMSMSMDIELPVANEGFEFDGKFQADPQVTTVGFWELVATRSRESP